jgi:TonB-dependent Receptor Plug Domain
MSPHRRLLATLLAIAVLAPALAGGSESFAGLPLAEALRRLQRAGVDLVFSSELVDERWIVNDEPATTDVATLLRSLLEPFGLRAVAGPSGTWLVVRADRPAQVPAQPTPRPGSTSESPPVASEEIEVVADHYRAFAETDTGARFLDRETIARSPHLFDDPYRVFARLPGAAAGDISSEFHLRGGQERELLVVVDGQEIAEPFHMKSLQSPFSVLAVDALGRVDLYTGGFPARFGGRMSGVLDLTTSPPPKRRRSTITLTSVDAGYLGAGSAGASGTWLAEARRGYLDLVADSLNVGGKFRPTYSDLLGRVSHSLGASHDLAIELLASQDDTTYASDSDSERIHVRYGGGNLWTTLASTWTAALSSSTALSVARGTHRRKGGDRESTVDDARDADETSVRQDWAFESVPGRRFEWGFDLRRLGADYEYSSRSVLLDDILTGGVPLVRERAVGLSPAEDTEAAYLSTRIATTGSSVLEAGVRWEHQSTPGDRELDPRLSWVWRRGSGSVRASWGRYSQPQRLDELEVEDGVTKLAPAERTDQLSLGWERTLSSGLRFALGLYDKRATRLRSRYVNLFDPIELFPEANYDRVRLDAAEGRSRGAELWISFRRSDLPLSGWVSYVRSSARDRVDGHWQPRAWDQPESLTLSLDWRRPSGWSAALVAIYHSGWPTTAVFLEEQADGNGGARLIPRLGALYAERFPPYSRVDLRVARTRPTAWGSWTLALEVQNLLDHSNVCCVDHFELVDRMSAPPLVVPRYGYWLPRLPSFGVTWEF